MLTKKLSSAVEVLFEVKLFLLSLPCLAYIMQFFIPIFNMEYRLGVVLTNLIIIK